MMDTLGALFPSAPFSVLKNALAQNGGNIDAAASYVLLWMEQQPVWADGPSSAPAVEASSSSSFSSSSRSTHTASATVIDLTDDQGSSLSHTFVYPSTGTGKHRANVDPTPVTIHTAGGGSSQQQHQHQQQHRHQPQQDQQPQQQQQQQQEHQQQKTSFEEFMAMQELSRQEEEARRQAEIAALARMKDNFIEMLEAQFPGISTKFISKLMEQKKAQAGSDEEMLDQCMEEILKLNGKYPVTKRKAVDEENEDDEDIGADGFGHQNNYKSDDEDESSNDEGSDLEQWLSQSQKPQEERDLYDITIKMKPEYESSCATQIFRDYPSLAHKPIRDALMKHNYHYVPTYFYLDNLWMQSADLPVAKQRGIVLKVPRKKGKFTIKKDAAFRRERRWLKQKLAKDMAELDKAEREAENLREYTARGELMTCGCCYDDEIPANRVTTCGDGHMFCLECGRRAAENEIGMSRTELKCLTPDCTSFFSDAEAKRFLSKIVFDRLMRIRQQKELEKAGIESLVECPFCPYAAIVENENDKEFRCQSPKCRAVSCRLCRAITHIPLTCEEYAKQREQDTVLSAQHRAEEEMSKALIRECTKCKTRFFKEDGCNKMTCPTCMTVTCYLCKKEIRNGYAHFDPTPANAAPGNPNLCRLWEDTLARHEREVREAREKAIDRLQKENPDVVDKLRLDVPELPRPPNKRHKRGRR